MNSRKGFTLVELLAVIAILAILVIIALPNVMNMVNKARQNTFETQVRKAVQASQQKLLTNSNTKKTFDCSDVLTGNTFSECSASVNGTSVTVDALGEGKFSNYLMIDVTEDADSGVLIDLNKLKEVKINDEDPFKETLVKNSKINEPIFKLLTADEYIELGKKLGLTVSAENKKQYEGFLSNISYENNLLVNQTDDDLIAIFKINFTNKMLGKYKVTWYDVAELALNDDAIENKRLDLDLIFESYNFDSDGRKLEGTINVTKSQNYYFASMLQKETKSIGFELERIGQTESLQLVGNKKVTIKLKDVNNYKDAGITNEGNSLADDEYYAYTNIKNEVGDYKYIYIVKTNKGIKKLVRNIKVVDYTDSRCFKFNNGVIEQYYYYIDNDSSKDRCPTYVTIPEQINGKDVIEIGSRAFTTGCDGGVVKLTGGASKMGCSYSGMGITAVEFPNTLKYIERNAFRNNNISELTFPKSIQTIMGGAFVDNRLQKITFEGNEKDIKIMCSAFDSDRNSQAIKEKYKNNVCQ